jgi:hypothetical protein
MRTTDKMVDRIEALWVQAYNTLLKELSFRELQDILKLRKETEEAVTDIHKFTEKKLND